MKVALVLCPEWDDRWPTVSLALLSAQLKARGHEVRVFDVNLEIKLLARRPDVQARLPAPVGPYPLTLADADDEVHVLQRMLPAYAEYLDSLADRLAAYGPRVAGFSLYLTNTAVSLHLAQRLKARAPGTTVVFGGPSCEDLESCVRLVQKDCVDAVVSGEGDRTFPSLLDALEATGRLCPSGGVVLKDPATWREGCVDVVDDIDQLPYSDFEAFPLLPHYLGKTLNACRGCVRRCVFCSEWRGREYRQMSGKRIYAEVRHQLERHPTMDRFLFADSLVNGSLKSLEAFCDELLASGTRIRWAGHAIVRREMTLDALRRLRCAGCYALWYGVESGSARVLRDMDKYVAPELNGRVLQETRRAGIEAITLMMVGFPTETEEDFAKSLDFIRRNGGAMNELHFHILTIGEMRGQLDRYGVEPPAHPIFWRTRDGLNTYPVRLERLRRAVETAAESGVKTIFESDLPPEAALKRYDSTLEAYRRYEEARLSSAA